MSSAENTGRFEIIDALRGIAAMAVCWYHFTQNTSEFILTGFVKSSGTYGYLGVPIFFVISGFVIPYSLFRSSYQLRDYFKFVAKRLIRLDPPYFVSLALMLLVGFVLMHFSNTNKGIPPFSSWPQLLSHFGYLNAILHYEWLSPIYWTLAVEFQFYLLFGLIFVLLSGRNSLLAMATASCLLALAIKDHDLVFNYLPWFCFGITAFTFVTRQLGFYWYLAVTGALFAFVLPIHGLFCAVLLLSTSLLISFVRITVGRVLTFFGTISYSIYLLHIPVGRTIINQSVHFQPSEIGRLFVLALAMAATIIASYLAYLFIEKPSMKLAARIRYGAKAQVGTTLP